MVEERKPEEKEPCKCQPIQPEFEKPWYKSKKFVAFLLMEVVFTVVTAFTLKWQTDIGWPTAAFLVAIVFTMGFIAISFTGKQAMLDMYVRGIALTGQLPEKLASTFTDKK